MDTSGGLGSAERAVFRPGSRTSQRPEAKKPAGKRDPCSMLFNVF
jgi:hypothetical protein